MNILIPYNWLKDYLKTGLAPKEFASTISLYGPSIEKWHEAGNDVVFDAEITTNRIDAYSIYGLAREAHAILQNNNIESSLNKPDMPEIVNGSGINLILAPDVDPKLCPRFTAVVLDGVDVGKSPKFMSKRLEAVNVRSLNNVVDVTNYVMFELGQPMHVFDYDKIAGHRMILRKSRAGETLKTLDGTTRKLPEGAIVIQDEEKLIDLAGIMGGENSAVDENTRRVVLFAQTYNPHIIRKTAMALTHRTEASARFEKGLDPEMVLPALQRGVVLLREHAGAVVASDMIDIYPNPYEPKEVVISQSVIDKIVGVEIPIEQAVAMLELLGFDTTVAAGVLTASVPSFRADDIDNALDLVEEVARMYGYHNIPSQLPTGEIPNVPDNPTNKCVKQTKIALKYFGYTETYTNSATSKDNIEKFGTKFEHVVKIKNPLSEDFVYMRTHLLQTVLPVVAENLARFPNLEVFELSKIYELAENELPTELRKLLLITTDVDILRLKGQAETIFHKLGIHTFDVWPDVKGQNIFQPGSYGVFHTDKLVLGEFGPLDRALLSRYGIDKPLLATYLDFEQCIMLARSDVLFTPIPKFPPVIEDLSVVVGADQYAGPMIEAVKSAHKLVASVEVIDTFTSKTLGKTKKSITFRITYQDPTNLLSDKQVAPIRDKIAQALVKQFAAQIRQ